jgi:hypothetical protein
MLKESLVNDKLVKEGEYWVVYRQGDGNKWCPLLKTKDKKIAKIILN